MQEALSLCAVVPALNEEANLRATILGLAAPLGEAVRDWEILIVDDGSTDRTRAIAEELAAAEPRIRVLHHDRPQGIGASFVHGVRETKASHVLLIPGDNEVVSQEILRYIDLLEHVDIVVPFFVNREVRSRGRRLVSTLFRAIVNLLFGTSFSYTNGTVVYSARALRNIRIASPGFFYQTEALVKLARQGYWYAEVPALLRPRDGGHAKALSLKNLVGVCVGCLRLVAEIHILRTAGRTTDSPWPSDSVRAAPRADAQKGDELVRLGRDAPREATSDREAARP